LTPTTWPRPVRGLLLSSVSIKAGLKRAVAQGVKLGRPKIDSATERKVRKQLAKGLGILKVAKLGIGTGTVQRISKDLGSRQPALNAGSCLRSLSPFGIHTRIWPIGTAAAAVRRLTLSAAGSTPCCASLSVTEDGGRQGRARWFHLDVR
jgi:hypothetical protein